MRLVSSFSIALWSCALPAQLQHVSSSIPGASAPGATGNLPQVSLPRAIGACDPDHDHCVRPATWFLIEHASPGSASPATPVFDQGGKWVSYQDGAAARTGYVLHTQLASATKTKVRDVLIVLRPNDDEPLYPVSEDAAQTTARWVVMVVETVDPAAATFTIQGRADVPIPLASARRVVETKEVRRPSER